jgi:hypothetical protein
MRSKVRLGAEHAVFSARWLGQVGGGGVKRSRANVVLGLRPSPVSDCSSRSIRPHEHLTEPGSIEDSLANVRLAKSRIAIFDEIEIDRAERRLRLLQR